MNAAFRWGIAIVGWLGLLIIYGVWKDAERHTGGGFITGALRGVIFFGGAFLLYRWAKNGGSKQQCEPIASPASSMSSTSVAHPPSNAGPAEVKAQAQSAPATPRIDGRTAMSADPSRHVSSPTVVDEDPIYILIAEELEAGRPEKALWTRLYAECEGNENRTRALYIKRRAERLISAERLRLAEAGRDQAAEVEKAERLRPPPTEEQQMAEHGITFDGERYIYGEYKYDRLSDAINYANLQRRRSL